MKQELITSIAHGLGIEEPYHDTFRDLLKEMFDAGATAFCKQATSQCLHSASFIQEREPRTTPIEVGNALAGAVSRVEVFF